MAYARLTGSSHTLGSTQDIGGMFAPQHPVMPGPLVGRLIAPAYYHEVFNHPQGDDFIPAQGVHPAPQPDGPWNMRALSILADAMTPDNMFVIYGNPRDPFTPDF